MALCFTFNINSAVTFRSALFILWCVTNTTQVSLFTADIKVEHKPVIIHHDELILIKWLPKVIKYCATLYLSKISRSLMYFIQIVHKLSLSIMQSPCKFMFELNCRRQPVNNQIFSLSLAKVQANLHVSRNKRQLAILDYSHLFLNTMYSISCRTVVWLSGLRAIVIFHSSSGRVFNQSVLFCNVCIYIIISGLLSIFHDDFPY